MTMQRFALLLGTLACLAPPLATPAFAQAGGGSSIGGGSSVGGGTSSGIGGGSAIGGSSGIGSGVGGVSGASPLPPVGGGLSGSGLGSSNLGSSNLGSSGLGTSGLGTSGLGTSGLGISGLGTSGLGQSGVSTGLGAGSTETRATQGFSEINALNADAIARNGGVTSASSIGNTGAAGGAAAGGGYLPGPGRAADNGIRMPSVAVDLTGIRRGLQAGEY